MSNVLKSEQDGVLHLVSGIITDVRMLIKQQLALFRHEIRGEIVDARKAGSLIAVGFTVVAIGVLLLCGMLVHLLAQLAPDLPLWACYGIVSAPIIVVGAILCLIGVQKFKHIDTAMVVSGQHFKEKFNG